MSQELVHAFDRSDADDDVRVVVLTGSGRGPRRVSVALTRQMFWRMLGAEHPMAAHPLDSRAIAARGVSADAHEGVTAVLEKRPARFPDLVAADLPEFFPWWPDRPFTPPRPRGRR